MRSQTSFVFLIGAARSGTKYLRDILGHCPEISTTPYDLNYIWRHGNERMDHDELTPDDISDKAAAHIRGQVEQMAYKSSGQAPVILEKTVSNTLRVDLVRRVFPGARFIYLEREGRNVVESSYRQWTAPPDRTYLLNKLRYFPLREWRYALWFAQNLVTKSDGVPVWGPRYDGISEDLESLGVAATCATQWARSVVTARRALDPADTFVVRYEQLNDGETFDSLLTWLDVAPAKAVAAHDAQFRIQTTWPGSIPEADRSACADIIDRVPPLTQDGTSSAESKVNEDLS